MFITWLFNEWKTARKAKKYEVDVSLETVTQRLLRIKQYLQVCVRDEKFDMRISSVTGGRSGDVLCLLGHVMNVPGCEPIPKDRELTKEDIRQNFPASGDVDRYNYSIRLFDFVAFEAHYLFAASWADVDNTREGAIKRIDFFLEHFDPYQKEILRNIQWQMHTIKQEEKPL